MDTVLPRLTGTLAGQFTISLDVMIKDESGIFAGRNYDDTDYIGAHFDTLELDNSIKQYNGSNYVNIVAPVLTGNRTATWQDASGTIAYTADITTAASTLVSLVPGSSTRNIIQPTGDYKALIVRGHASQTVNLQEWQTSASGTVASINTAGLAAFAGINSTPIGATTPSTGAFTTLSTTGDITSTAGSKWKPASDSTTALNIANAAGTSFIIFDTTNSRLLVGAAGASDARLNVNGPAGGIALAIQNSGSSPGNMQEWRNSSGTALSFVNSSGQFKISKMGVANAAPTAAIAAVIQPNVATDMALLVRGFTAQSANLIEVQTSSAAVRFAIGPENIASASGATLRSLYAAAQTITITGSTNITTSTGFNLVEIGQPTLTSSNSLTVTNSATLYIANSPAVSGSTTLTNPYALWVDAGFTRLDGEVGIGAGAVSGTMLRVFNGDVRLERNDTTGIQLGAYWGGSTTYGLTIAGNISSTTSFVNGYAVRIGLAFSAAPTTGTTDVVRAFGSTFNPSSGTAVYNVLGFDATINQTGTATGITRGIRVNPTVTAAVDFRGIEIDPSFGVGALGSLYGLRIADIAGGSTNYAIYTNAGLVRFGDNVVIADAKNIVLDTTTGTKIGTSATQKLALWNVTPIVQPVNTVAIDTLLVNVGLRASGGVALFDTDIKAGVVGKGLYIKEGTDATMGTATLSGGTVTVNTSKVTANSRIYLTAQNSGTAQGAVYVSARSAGTSFTITSTNGSDDRDVAWIIIEPA